MAVKCAFLILILLFISCDVKAQRVERLVFMTRISTERNKYGWPESASKKHLDITCIDNPFTPVVYPEGAFKEIIIHTCKIPNLPLAKQLKDAKINVTDLQKLQFTDSHMDPPFPVDYTADLPINSLEISNTTNFNATPEFFTPMKKLRELAFEKVLVSKLPPSKSLPIEVLRLKEASVQSWDNCESLKELHIEKLTKEQVPKKWPTNCSQLKTLVLESMMSETVQHVMDSMEESSVMKLETLKVKKCSLKQLPMFLMQSKILEHLDLSDNKLDDDNVTSQLPTMETLKVLNLSNNEGMSGRPLLVLPTRTPALRELYVGGLHLDQFGDLEKFDIRESLVKLTSLEILNVDGAHQYKDVLHHYYFQNLKYLSLRNLYFSSILKHLKLHSFPSTGVTELTVDLRGLDNKVTEAQYVSVGPKFVESFDNERSSRSWLTLKGYKLTVLLDFVDCDCKNDVLWHALKLFPHFLAIPNLKCSHGGLFIDEPIENLSCRKATVNGCLRKMSRDADYVTDVNCTNVKEKFRWPRPRGFRKLIAIGNGISSVDKAYLPDSLQWLDLRDNNISRLSGEQSARLFGNKGRRVRLSGNPIICDCDNQLLLDSLHANQSLIMDYDDLTCVDSGKLLRLVSVDELCRSKSVIAVVLMGVLALLMLVVALLARHYWTTLRMILFAHGCCISCLQQTDSDDDRPYDAFLSFAHGDEEYVTEKLLPQLEGEPNFYRICVHYRDWAVGEWIPAQIMQSVRLSKRTIIVLSKNFMESCWGMLEFRHANASAMADGRQRLLVVVLDDVISERLSPEIQGYLELNTYLKCDDPWFWEKLRYGMPHKVGKQVNARRYFENSGQRNVAFKYYVSDSEEESLEVIEETVL